MGDLESEETSVEIETKEGQVNTASMTVNKIEMTGEDEIGIGEIVITTGGDRSHTTTTSDEDGKCTWEQTRGKLVEGIFIFLSHLAQIC